MPFPACDPPGRGPALSDSTAGFPGRGGLGFGSFGVEGSRNGAPGGKRGE